DGGGHGLVVVVVPENIVGVNDDHEAVATAIAGSEADVVVLQELQPQLRRGLAAHPSLAGFHRASDVLDERSQLALWSRWPLADVELSQVADRPQIEATVLSPHGEFRVHAVHLAAPVDGELAADWSEGIARLRDVETGRPAVVAGDFNATDHHVQFRSVLGQGWTDVHHPKGCGFDATWPVAGSRLPVPLLRLDHVLVTEHWEVLAVTIGPPQGSDHRSVVATVRLRR
ncbi:MAG: endonuclease/exonuclease/phosphatase family protein, partial [Actinomycetota bacterium]